MTQHHPGDMFWDTYNQGEIVIVIAMADIICHHGNGGKIDRVPEPGVIVAWSGYHMNSPALTRQKFEMRFWTYENFESFVKQRRFILLVKA